MSRRRIGVWGHYHGGNIGDDIVVSTLISQIRHRLPEHEVYGFSLNPRDTAARHGVPSHSLDGSAVHHPPTKGARGSADEAEDHGSGAGSGDPGSKGGEPQLGGLRRLISALKRIPGVPRLFRLIWHVRTSLRIWRILRGFDAVVVAGSGPVFDDMGGAWVHPYNLFRWSLLSRMAGARFILLNAGAGPVHHRLSRWFLKWALRLASYRSFRDQASVELAMSLGVQGPDLCVADSAFAVEETEIDAAVRDPITASRPLVGIGTMAYMDPRYWPNADVAIYRSYLAALAELSEWLLGQGFDLVLLKSQRRADARPAGELLDLLAGAPSTFDSSRVLNLPTESHRDLLKQIAGCEFVVGGRFHLHVLPFLLGKPVLGVSYHPKTEELMVGMGQEDLFLSMDSVTGDGLIRLCKQLLETRSEIEGRIHGEVMARRKALIDQFDHVFSSDGWARD